MVHQLLLDSISWDGGKRQVKFSVIFAQWHSDVSKLLSRIAPPLDPPPPHPPCSWRQGEKREKGGQGRSVSCGAASYVRMTRPFKVDLDGHDSLWVGNSASTSVNVLDVNQECAHGWRAGQPDCCASPPAVAAERSRPPGRPNPAYYGVKQPVSHLPSDAAFPHFLLTC